LDKPYFMKNKPVWLVDLFKKIEGFCLGVQAGVARTILTTYIRYTYRGKMFAKIKVKQDKLQIYLRLEYAKLEQKPAFIRDYTPVARQTWIELSITENDLLKNETILLDVTCNLIKQSFTRILKNPTLSRFPTFGKKAVPEFVNHTLTKFSVEIGTDGFCNLGIRVHKSQLTKVLEKFLV
ncbi:unnamed protein product, partial [marine sediment metagenome]